MRLYRCRVEAAVPARSLEEVVRGFAAWLRSTAILEGLVTCTEEGG